VRSDSSRMSQVILFPVTSCLGVTGILPSAVTASLTLILSTVLKVASFKITDYPCVDNSGNHTICCFLVNTTNRCTEFQFYWHYDSTCFGQSFCPSSGVLSRTSALVQFMQFGDRVLPGAGWSSHTVLKFKHLLLFSSINKFATSRFFLSTSHLPNWPFYFPPPPPLLF
jgi:hypothetical protein